MLNINYGHNRTLMQGCKPLEEYAWLVDMIRRKSVGMDISDAVDQAIDEMPEAYEIKALLIEHRAEVKGMLLTEYNETETMELFREEGRQLGLQEGVDSSTKNIAKSMIEEHEPASKISKYTGLSVEELKRLAKGLGMQLV